MPPPTLPLLPLPMLTLIWADSFRRQLAAAAKAERPS